eukprot:CAMPEP_0185381648 /NCGR_PEP_ID=MMETSP1364-20130426/53217_1 /TAXON_ID=38817 /ORGANISM="Gephyrocapsa oceanica, Strain RCC1303" /LENGTH=70 /DNA_ID=CAMNT_0027983311 /DNA_START=44 /DNA_END=252 /DNA_ORIENTATION=-
MVPEPRTLPRRWAGSLWTTTPPPPLEGGGEEVGRAPLRAQLGVGAPAPVGHRLRRLAGAPPGWGPAIPMP